MAGSPFGLAYGIGAGLSGLPNSVQAGKEQALAMSMKNLQLQDMQKQMRDQEIMDATLSMPLNPRMQDVDVMSANPAYAEQNALYQQKVNTLTDLVNRRDAGEPGLDEQIGGFQSGAPQPTAPEQIKTGTAKKAYEWSTPHEKMAWELEQRAGKLAEMGLGRSAYKLQQEATQYQSMHIDKLGQDAAKYIATGSQSAVPLLKKLGYEGAESIVTLGDAGKTRAIKMSDGSIVPMSPGALAAMSAGGKIGDFLNHQAQWGMSLEGRLASIEATKMRDEGRLGLGYAQEEGRNTRNTETVEGRHIDAGIRASAMKSAGLGKLPAKVATYNEAERRVLAAHPEWKPGTDDQKIADATAMHPLVVLASKLKDNDTPSAQRFIASFKGERPDDPVMGPLFDEAVARVRSHGFGAGPGVTKTGGFTVKNGKVTASSNPAVKVGSTAMRSDGTVLPDKEY